jgi:hypothetical protein
MSSTDDFCLKWNDHHSIFFSSAESLCQANALTDVTLSAGTREFAAHKIVLAVCSNYFANLFAGSATKSGDTRHVIVYLKDVDARHMELLLSYMYRGEINVQENELMGLLATAKSLQIKGLTDSSDNESESPVTTPAGAATATPEDVARSRAANNPNKSALSSKSRSKPPKILQRGGGSNLNVQKRSSPGQDDLPDVKKVKMERWSDNTVAATSAGASMAVNSDGGGGGDSSMDGGDYADDYGDNYDGDEAEEGGDYPVPEDGGPAIYEDQGDQNMSTVSEKVTFKS